MHSHSITSWVHDAYCAHVCATAPPKLNKYVCVRTVKLNPGREQMIPLPGSSYLIGFSLWLLQKHRSLKFKAVRQSESCQGPLSHWQDAIMILDHTRITLPGRNRQAKLRCSQLNNVLPSIYSMCQVRIQTCPRLTAWRWLSHLRVPNKINAFRRVWHCEILVLVLGVACLSS